ncbi:MAG TPA: translation initiation factor IF-2 [Chitinophagaceae bacterium]|nr:translation initiation factor IF-2 [Chitinophagaceae bacterium]
MSESTNTIRLMKAAKEFNVGRNTIIDFLKNAGFAIDNKPDPILSSEMYHALITEYDSEKAAKKKSDKLVLNKTTTEEKTIVDKPTTPIEKKEEKTSLKQDIEKPKVVGKIDLTPKEKPSKKKTKEEPKIEEVPQEETTIKQAEEKKPKTKKEKETTESTEDKTSKKTKKEKEDEIVKANTAKLEGLKIKGKIELTKEKKEKKPTEEPLAAALPTEELPIDEVVPHTVERKPRGLTVVGKIELPTTQPKDQSPKELKKKKKRIPIENKGNSDKTGNTTNQQKQQTRTDKPGFKRDFKGTRNGDHYKKPEEKVIDQNEIQDKIKQTLAKLGNTTRGKSLKAKHRRNKREEMAEKRAIQEGAIENNKLQLTEFISVSELANLLDINFTEVISKCMSLGIMVSINQRLDAEVIELVASEFGYEVEFINLEEEADQENEAEDLPENLEHRAPIVTIMGHVDHGKTSLLDYIRNASVVAGEAGGITQHIGAYEVTIQNGKRITFLDTPGHEAFTAMRARGAKLTDIAVIVVAADDSVMPQTKEAISHAQAAGVPMIFAINKIDKDGANPDKIREQLSGMNILVEEWGGKFQSQEISAKSGLNVDLLLEKILLEAEILDLKANPNRNATGAIVEASLDKGRGFVSTILVQNGTLKIGDMIVAGSNYGRVKAMVDERGKRKTSAGPSTPVQILGLNGAPQSGEKFKVYEDEVEAKDIANHRAQIMREQGMRTKKHITLDEIGRRLALGNFKQLNVIIKGDVDGSVEALSDSLQKLSTEEIAVSVVHKAVGQITESDVLLATASDAIILGFQVRPSMQASKLADHENIEIRYYSIIYDAIEEIKSAMEGMLEPKIEKKTVCNIEVREVYKITGVGTIAGCHILDGKIKRDTKINLIRDGIVIFNGELSSLKRYKDDVKEVLSGMECGIGIKNYNDLKAGDMIEGYDEIEIKRTL